MTDHTTALTKRARRLVQEKTPGLADLVSAEHEAVTFVHPIQPVVAHICSLAMRPLWSTVTAAATRSSYGSTDGPSAGPLGEVAAQILICASLDRLRTAAVLEQTEPVNVEAFLAQLVPQQQQADLVVDRARRLLEGSLLVLQFGELREKVGGIIRGSMLGRMHDSHSTAVGSSYPSSCLTAHTLSVRVKSRTEETDFDSTKRRSQQRFRR